MESWKSEEEEEDNQRRHSHFRKSLFFTRNGQRERQNSSAKKGFFGVNKGSHCPIHSSHHGRRLERILHLRLFLRGIEDDVRGRLHFIASRLRLALFIRPPIYGIANAAKIFVRPLPALWRACLFYMPSVQTNLPTHHSSPNWRRRHIANTFLRVICSRLFHLLFFLLLSFSYNTHTREEEEEETAKGGRKKEAYKYYCFRAREGEKVPKLYGEREGGRGETRSRKQVGGEKERLWLSLLLFAPPNEKKNSAA